MASPFRFGFSGDDIGESDDVGAGIQRLGLGDDLQRRQCKKGVEEERVDGRPIRYEPRRHMLDDLVRCLSFFTRLAGFCCVLCFMACLYFCHRRGLRGANYALTA